MRSLVWLGVLAFPLALGCAPRDRETFENGGSGGDSGSAGATNGGSAGSTNGGNAGTAGDGGNGATGGTSSGGSGGTGGISSAGASAGGTGGMPGAGLGAVCKSTADCPTGLSCGLHGFRDGVCTTDCSSSSDCPGADSACVNGQCFLKCDYGPQAKCGGRLDTVCGPTQDASGANITACIQICQVDADCVNGYCDPYGSCIATPFPGPKLGEACSVSQMACNCINADSTSDNGFCSAFCRTGADGNSTCEQAPSGDLTSVCIFATNEMQGVGDLGYCGKTCKCDGECPRDTVCTDVGLPQAQNGACVPDNGSQQNIPCP